MNNENQELEVNKKKREEFEQLMKDSSTKTEDYWDKNNLFVRLLLLVLGIIIVLGVIYYALAFFS